MDILIYFLFIVLSSIIVSFLPKDEPTLIYNFGFFVGFVGHMILHWKDEDE